MRRVLSSCYWLREYTWMCFRIGEILKGPYKAQNKIIDRNICEALRLVRVLG